MGPGKLIQAFDLQGQASPIVNGGEPLVRAQAGYQQPPLGRRLRLWGRRQGGDRVGQFQQIGCIQCPADTTFVTRRREQPAGLIAVAPHVTVVNLLGTKEPTQFQDQGIRIPRPTSTAVMVRGEDPIVPGRIERPFFLRRCLLGDSLSRVQIERRGHAGHYGQQEEQATRPDSPCGLAFGSQSKHQGDHGGLRADSERRSAAAQQPEHMASIRLFFIFIIGRHSENKSARHPPIPARYPASELPGARRPWPCDKEASISYENSERPRHGCCAGAGFLTGRRAQDPSLLGGRAVGREAGGPGAH